MGVGSAQPCLKNNNGELTRGAGGAQAADADFIASSSDADDSDFEAGDGSEEEEDEAAAGGGLFGGRGGGWHRAPQLCLPIVC